MIPRDRTKQHRVTDHSALLEFFLRLLLLKQMGNDLFWSALAVLPVGHQPDKCAPVDVCDNCVRCAGSFAIDGFISAGGGICMPMESGSGSTGPVDFVVRIDASLWIGFGLIQNCGSFFANRHSFWQ